jgi:CubicO group peptidase (beta-lactamase class C family)
LYSTTADLLRFIQAYAHGRVLPAEVVNQIWIDKPGNNYGWFVRKSHGELAVATNGRSPGFTSSATYFPARDLSVIVLSNSYSPESPIAGDVAALAMGKTVPTPGSIVPVAFDPAAFQKFTGRYKFGPDFFRPGAEVQLSVHNGDPVIDWGNDFYSVLIPVGPGEFVDRQFWARMHVNPDAASFGYSTSGSDFKVVRSDKR